MVSPRTSFHSRVMRRPATGIHRGKLVVPVPFPMEIDLTTLFTR